MSLVSGMIWGCGDMICALNDMMYPQHIDTVTDFEEMEANNDFSRRRADINDLIGSTDKLERHIDEPVLSRKILPTALAW